MNLPADLIATSGGWGVIKPSPEFFDRIAREVKCRPEEIAYVGDRVDNDVVPAAEQEWFPSTLFVEPGVTSSETGLRYPELTRNCHH